MTPPPPLAPQAEPEPGLRPDAPSREGRQPAAIDLPRFVRVDAELRLVVGTGTDGAPRLDERREQGAFRFRMPRISGRSGPARALEVLTVNVAGGLAGGDRLRLAASAENGAQVALSSATAERIYRSASNDTEIALSLRSAGGGRMAWLPHETILHDGARLTRQVEIAVDDASHLLLAEILHLGRAASGESFTAGSLRESWRVCHDGRLVFADEMRLAPHAGSPITNPAILDGARAVATLLMIGRDAETALERLRAVVGHHRDIEAGVTARPGLVFARLIGKDGAALRRATLAMIGVAADGFPLPRLIAQDIADAQECADVQERPDR